MMWGNPFQGAELQKEISKEFNDPANLFRASTDFDCDFTRIQNPLHIFKPLANESPLTTLFEEL